MPFIRKRELNALIEAYKQQIRNNGRLVLQKPELAEYFTTYSDQYVHGLTLQEHRIRADRYKRLTSAQRKPN